MSKIILVQYAIKSKIIIFEVNNFVDSYLSLNSLSKSSNYNETLLKKVLSYLSGKI